MTRSNADAMAPLVALVIGTSSPLKLTTHPLDPFVNGRTFRHLKEKEPARMNTSPHENEYLAAVAAMPEHTISPVVVHGLAVGDRISYRLRDWGNSSWSAGRVIGDAGPDRVWVNDEITNRPQAVDVRPWPAGEVLPF